MILQLDIMAILPELILFFGAMGLLMVGVFSSSNLSRPISLSSIILLLVAAIVVLFQSEEAQFAFNGALLMNDFTALMKALTFLAVAASLVLAHDFMHLEKIERFEYPVLVLLASCGMSIMISANDLIAVYMGLELQSLALYVVASINRDSVRSTEAGLKYFVLGALSSGMLLYGVSLIYGFSGTVNFQELASLGFTGNDIGLVFGMVFLMAGLAFKISAVPFHMWTPDVYEGAPTPVTAFLAVAPKLAAMALFMRAVITIFPQAQDAWQQIIIFMSFASMVLGSLAAIGQQSIKRLMAYSSIGHIGFALVGFAAIAGDNSAEGVNGVIIYVIIYSVMTIGTFACILSMRR
ncbi:MAG: NADH-quinone oxidoreductase subunit N, partial [Pseudomonadota bacterium]|nr:NADH-quinone oxidoreductase subunit N [Pseudomonadota bacterium]